MICHRIDYANEKLRVRQLNCVSSVVFDLQRGCWGASLNITFLANSLHYSLSLSLILGQSTICFSNRLSQGLLFLRICHVKKWKITTAVTTISTFFHQNTCSVNKKVHIFVKSI